jgi:glycosyltransferase involved in cell wall biosynthesis
VVTILLDSSGPLKAEFASESVEIIEYDVQLRSAGGSPTAAWGEVARRLADRSITYGICNSVLCGQVVEKLAGRGFTCLSLVHELMDSVIGFGWERYAESIMKQAAAIVFPGNVVRERFLGRYGAPRGKVRVIAQPPNININDLQSPDAAARRGRLRRGLRLSEDDFLVLSTGTGDFRKGIDLFMQTAVTALQRSENNSRRLYFAWLGDVPTAHAVWIKKDLRERGLEDRVLFLRAQQVGVADYFMASDVFFLPSREDPFPTVVIEALHVGLPVVAFEGTGGVLEQVGGGAGSLAPYGDWASAADILVEFSTVDLSRRRSAALAQAAKFSTPESYSADVLNLLQFGLTHDERINERPRSELIGVGVPAYQCSEYIEERLWSIFEQSLVPGEILVVDDDSVDGTPEVVDRLRVLAPCPFRFIQNAQNSGSPFPQWKRCLEELNREFVWIAESDDSARLRFLEDLTPFVREPENVRLVYAKTATMNAYSEENLTGHEPHLRSVASLPRWETSYLRSGKAEISEVLAFENTIPNVSACLVRRAPALEALEGVTRYRTAGDWVFYLNLLRDGKIAYCREALNLHRRHTHSTITRLESQPIFHIERAGAHIRARAAGHLGPAEAERMIDRENKEFARLCDDGGAGANRGYLDLLQRMLREGDESGLDPEKRRVLVIIPDLHVGGGQMAGIRLANALAHRHYVSIFAVDHSAGYGSLADRIGSRVTRLPDGDFAQLLSFVEAAQIELISSHVWWSDKLAYRLKQGRPETRWLITMHGCYERILQEPEIDPWYYGNVKSVLSAADGIAYLADKNLTVFNHVKIPKRAGRIQKVYNGIDVPQEVSVAVKKKQQPGRVARSFVMVGRGIEEKGWKEAAEALRQTNARLAAERRQAITLTFVGSGDCLSEMRREDRYRNLPLQMQGAVSNVFPLLARADVGLLPSFFAQESLPNAVAEYLLCRIPAIVTRIGEVPAMIASEKGDAGTVIGFKNGRADVNALAAAMYTYATNAAIFGEHVDRTMPAAAKFGVDQMIHQYSKLTGIRLSSDDDTEVGCHDAEKRTTITDRELGSPASRHPIRRLRDSEKKAR